MHLFLMLSISIHVISFFFSSFPPFPIASVHTFGYRPLIISVIEISGGHRSAFWSSLFFVSSLSLSSCLSLVVVLNPVSWFVLPTCSFRISRYVRNLFLLTCICGI